MKAILEFTYKGRRNTYFRRIDAFGQPLTTTNKNSAKQIKLEHTEKIVHTIIEKLGKTNVKDVKVIKLEG